ncbi:hypothetical protein [Catenovulum adriaticum]|uniref:Uncharacterized protein n=1 Tax=Catenovulum adriaticum TaxID=2984846 RepID=A0ABY7ALJ4_9ALTE|nr:hypothetical protein [Catenovulum sp. TS8]WAJ70170.1 hypothetical protein OLW01_13655 [Catenovulum sp. TS8]
MMPVHMASVLITSQLKQPLYTVEGNKNGKNILVKSSEAGDLINQTASVVVIMPSAINKERVVTVQILKANELENQFPLSTFPKDSYIIAGSGMDKDSITMSLNTNNADEIQQNAINTLGDPQKLAQNMAGSGHQFIGFWSGDLITTKNTPKREYIEIDGVKKWVYSNDSKDTHYPIAIELTRNESGQINGYIYNEKENCIFEINQQPLQNNRNANRYLKLSSNFTHSTCENKSILKNTQLTLLENNKISVFARYNHASANKNKSHLTRQKSKQLNDKFAAALKELEIKLTPVFDDTPLFQQTELTYNGTSIELYFLFPHGFSKPNDAFIKVNDETNRCFDTLYSQQTINEKTILTRHTETCNLFEQGYFDVEPNPPLKITWRPDRASTKQTIATETQLLIKRNLPLKGYMEQLNNSYLSHNEQLSLALAAKRFLHTHHSRKTFLNEVFSKDLSFDQPNHKFIGSWQGALAIDDAFVQAELALWTGQLDDYNFMLGYLTIAKSCFYNVHLKNTNGKTSLQSIAYLKGHCTPEQVGMKSRLRTPVAMDAEGQFIKFEFKQGSRIKQSIRAAFKRAKPSPYMVSLFNSQREKTYTPPDKETLLLMDSLQVPGKSIEEKHEQALQQSADLLAQRKQAGKQIQQERDAIALKKWQKKKQQEIEQGIRKPTRSNSQPYSSSDYQPMPEVSGPFDGLAGATFLNAVYKGDASLVKRINQSYGASQIKGLKAFAGTFANSMTDAVINLYSHVKIQDSVAAKYLFEYDSHFAKCLSNTPVTFYVTGYQPDTVFTNLLGVEIARYYGGTTVNKYKVNPEFTDVFNKVGKTKPHGTMSGITSLLANQGSKDLRKSALKGIAQMRKKFACHSKEIKTFERNLISLYY